MKRWKIMLVVLLVLATSLTGFILVKRHQAKSALEAYRKELIARGELLEKAAWPEPKEEDLSRWEAVEAVIERFADCEFTSPSVIEITNNYAPGENLYSGDWYSESFEKAMDELTSREEDYQELLDLLDGSPLGAPHTNEAGRKLSRLEHDILKTHLALHLNLGNRRVAIRDIEAHVNLRNSLLNSAHAHQGFMIDFRLCIADIVASRMFSSEELGEIQSLLGKLDLTSDSSKRQRIYRADSLGLMTENNKSRERFHNFMTSSSDFRKLSPDDFRVTSSSDILEMIQENSRQIASNWKFRFLRERWFAYSRFSIEQRFLEHSQRHLEALDDFVEGAPFLVAARRHFTADHLAEKSDLIGAKYDWIANYGEYRAALLDETMRRLTLVAIALERRRLVRGSYPDFLDSLVPQFLATRTLDPWTGEPFHYRKNADGTFALFSKGQDAFDDRGLPEIWLWVPDYAAISWRQTQPVSQTK